MARRVVQCAALLAIGLSAGAQSPLERFEGYERYQAVRRGGAQVRGGTIRDLHWTDDGRLFFTREGDRLVVDLDSGAVAPAQPDAEPARGDDDDDRRRRRPGRGRQLDREPSPDGAWTAVAADWNVRLERADGTVVEVTTTGTRKHRFGQASWVYGEELDQSTAMWWSPDGSRLAYYEFDERAVPDHHLLAGLAGPRPTVLVEGYPKPGDPNPIASLHVYEVDTGRRVRIDTGPHGPGDPGHYVYRVQFRADGRELLFHRTNRRQDRLEVVAADVRTGAARVVLVETQATWQDNRPEWRFLEDGRRFIWTTERGGTAQFELRDLDGGEAIPLTPPGRIVASIVHVDEASGALFHLAMGPDHPLDETLYRVPLDGSAPPRRLTAGGGAHRPVLSPDGRWFVDRHESASEPPMTTLHRADDGALVAVLAARGGPARPGMEFPPPELFSFIAADGETTLYGKLWKPSDFDPARRYPLLVDVYGGPHFRQVRHRHEPARSICEFGVLVAKLDNRGTTGRGKAFEGATYMRLGDVDLADQVAGVRHLLERPYVDAERVGIEGHSYGGFMAALARLRHPEVFRVAVAGSGVYDWRNYDTIYTERSMRTPAENPEGYAAGSCLSYVEHFDGGLLLQHGLVDDNVHPGNVWQLVDAIQRTGRRVDTMLFPDRGHGLGGSASEAATVYLLEHLLEPRIEVSAAADRAGDEGARRTPAAAGAPHRP